MDAPSSYPLPAFEKCNVPVVFAADKNYARFFAVALKSLLKFASPEHNYDILLLSDDISEEDRRFLQDLARERENVSLRFVSTAPILSRAEKFYTCRGFSIAAYYRLFVASLFPAYEKILYLDVDLIVNADIAELFSVDLGENLIAAARDLPISAGTGKYVQGVVAELRKRGLRDRANYINSGVTLFNLKKLRERAVEKEFLELAAREHFEHHDQDVLNIVCQGEILILPQKWNFIAHQDPEKYAREDNAECFELLKNKTWGILHYPGTKPWKSLEKPMAYVWWQFALQTPFALDFFARFLTAHLAAYPRLVKKRRRCALMSRLAFGRHARRYAAKLRACDREISILRKFLNGTGDWRLFCAPPSE